MKGLSQHSKVLALCFSAALLGGLIARTDWGENRLDAKNEARRQLLSLEQANIEAAKTIRPSVVSIFSLQRVQTRRMNRSPFDDFFRNDPFFERYGDRFGRRLPEDNIPEKKQGPLQPRGIGSGVIIDKSGHILTNNHVVNGADELRVRFHDSEEVKASIVGVDPKTDLAVIKIDAADLKKVKIVPAKLGYSSSVQVGQWAIAVGSPFGLSQTVTAGIVSAIGREVGVAQFEDFIQTDAAINQGNSGGPLIDLNGEVIGINTAIYSRGGGNDGIGMSVSIDLARKVMEDLIEDGQVSRGWLGVGIQDLTEELASSFDFDGKGVLIGDVMPGGPAAKGGLEEGDIVTTIDGNKIGNTSELRKNIAGLRPSTRVKMKVWRDKKYENLTIKLGEMPDDMGRAMRGMQPKAEPEKSKLVEKVWGLRLQDAELKGGRKGVVVSSVAEGSLAAQAGIQPGDTITHVQNVEVKSMKQAAEVFASRKPSEGIRLRVSGETGRRYVFLKG